MDRQQKNWNDIYNEGGEGYVPSTKSEREQIASELVALQANQARTQADKDAETNARQDAYLAAEKADRDTDVRLIAYLARQNKTEGK